MTDSAPTRADVEAAAIAYLARRDHAEGELRAKLRRKDFPDTLIDQVFEDFRERGYLDDTRFAVDQGLILARKQWGPLQISYKLSQRGVSRTIIAIAIAEIETEVDWHALATERLHSKFRAPSNLDTKTRQKAYRHLLHRGFPSDVVRRVIS